VEWIYYLLLYVLVSGSTTLIFFYVAGIKEMNLIDDTCGKGLFKIPFVSQIILYKLMCEGLNKYGKILIISGWSIICLPMNILILVCCLLGYLLTKFIDFIGFVLDKLSED
jgi:hypothetical protein